MVKKSLLLVANSLVLLIASNAFFTGIQACTYLTNENYYQNYIFTAFLSFVISTLLFTLGVISLVLLIRSFNHRNNLLMPSVLLIISASMLLLINGGWHVYSAFANHEIYIISIEQGREQAIVDLYNYKTTNEIISALQSLVVSLAIAIIVLVSLLKKADRSVDNNACSLDQ